MGLLDRGASDNRNAFFDDNISEFGGNWHIWGEKFGGKRQKRRIILVGDSFLPDFLLLRRNIRWFMQKAPLN